MTCTVSTVLLRTSFRAFEGWWSLIETPKARILPSDFIASIPSSQVPRPTHSSDQTWNCWTSIVSRPRLLK